MEIDFFAPWILTHQLLEGGAVCVCVQMMLLKVKRSSIKDHVGFVPCEVKNANHSLFNCDLLTLSFLWCMFVIV